MPFSAEEFFDVFARYNEAILLLASPWLFSDLAFVVRPDARSLTGLAMIFFAAAIYPSYSSTDVAVWEHQLVHYTDRLSYNYPCVIQTQDDQSARQYYRPGRAIGVRSGCRNGLSLSARHSTEFSPLTL